MQEFFALFWTIASRMIGKEAVTGGAGRRMRPGKYAGNSRAPQA